MPTPGVDLTKLEGAIDSVIDRFRREGPTAEQMKKATAGIEFGSYSRLQSMLGKAMTLASGWIYHGDPAWYAKDLTETLAVTAADVKRVANTYLGPNRIVLSAVPMGKRNLASHRRPVHTDHVALRAEQAGGPMSHSIRTIAAVAGTRAARRHSLPRARHAGSHPGSAGGTDAGLQGAVVDR